MRLKNITEGDFSSISRLTKDEKVMKYVGNGQIWSEEKVRKFIKYNIEESKQSDLEREKYYYKIVVDDLFVGIIGFHKERGNKYALTVYLMRSKQGKGYFSHALKLLKNRIKTYKPEVNNIYSQVYPANESMTAIMEKKCEYGGKCRIGKMTLNEYIIPIKKEKSRIYGADYCPYCRSAKQLMEENGVEYEYIDLEKNDVDLSEVVGKDVRTIPQIFLNGKYIGGYDDLKNAF
jgi:glutaredoxin/RimJ/RimL family protein N-acetyltransferase